jgi:hypothetical protein
LTLGIVGKPLIQLARDREAENAVAEELEAFVRLLA